MKAPEQKALLERQPAGAGTGLPVRGKRARASRHRPDAPSHDCGEALSAAQPGWRRGVGVGGAALYLALAALGGFAADSRLVSNFALKPAPSGTNALPLAEAERLYLAEIEHRALTLGKKGFPAFKDALREADAARLRALLSPQFRAEVVDLSQGRVPEHRAVSIRRLRPELEPGTRTFWLMRDAFVDYLLGLRRKFASNPILEMKLVEFAPLERSKLDGAWRGTCKFRIAGVAVAGGPLEVFFELEFRLARVADVDEIAKDKEWIESMKVLEAYEVAAPRSLLVDVAKERGLDPTRLWDNWKQPPEEASVVTGGVFAADVDNDGLTDLLVTDLNGLFLYRRQPAGGFEEITHQAGLPRAFRAVSNAAFADFDNDGWVDLVAENRLYRNSGGRFEDITGRSNLRVGNLKYIVGYSVADFDNDGRVDLYVARSWGPTGRYGKVTWFDGPGGPGNMLFRNLGRWAFEDVSQKANARAGRRSVFTTAWLDANTDGWPDVYVINEFGGGVLLLNQRDGTFQEHSLTSGLGDFGSMGLAAADFNNDGHIDIYTANMFSKSGRRIVTNLAPDSYPPDILAKMKRFFPGSELYQNLGGLQFQPRGKELSVRAVGWAYGPTFVDLDNDGFLDLYATTGFMTVDNQEPDG